MNVCFVLGFTVPLESLVSKIYVYPETFYKRLEDSCDLFTLCYGICGDERGFDLCSRNKFCCLEVPTCNVINFSGGLVWFSGFINVHGQNVLLLFLRLVWVTHEGRIAHDIEVVGRLYDVAPVYWESVSFSDVVVVFERQTFTREVSFRVDFLRHLNISDP